MNTVYFPGLNTLRLYAAVCVVIFHANYYFAGHETLWLMSGDKSVTLFFVLSGFLMTYLLLKEKRTTGRINLNQYYLRRTLRIFPLYYLVIAVVFALPFLRPEWWTLPITLLFGMPFLHGLPSAPARHLGHLWSIGVEEMFYLMLPILLRRYSVVKVCVTIIVLRVVIGFLATHGADPYTLGVLTYLRFECMAVGGLAAWLYIERKPALQALYLPIVAWTSAALFVLMNFTSFNADHVIQSVIFAVVIVNLATNPRFPSFEHPVLSWWGKRTYGIYMWHYVILGIMTVLIPEFRGAVATVVLLVLTFVVAAASYEWFEKPFLELRNKKRGLQVTPATP